MCVVCACVCDVCVVCVLQEVTVLSSSLAQLKSIQRRLSNSKESLSSFSPQNKGGPGLVLVGVGHQG